MKTTRFNLLLAFAGILFFATSCKKDKEEDTFAADAQITADQNKADTEAEDVATIEDDVMSTFSSNLMRTAVSDTVVQYDNCATVTITPRRSNPTGTIVVDFGTEGCLGADGRFRKGKIIFTFTDRLRMPGAVVNTSFENYAVRPQAMNQFVSIDNASTKVTTNTGTEETNAENPLATFRKVIDMRVVLEDGRTITWAGTKNVAWNLAQLGNRWDNVYTLVSGSNLSGISGNGTPFTVVVDQNVVRKGACFLQGVYKPVSGQITIQHNNRTKTINYGNGACDRSVTVTINGRTRTLIW